MSDPGYPAVALSVTVVGETTPVPGRLSYHPLAPTDVTLQVLQEWRIPRHVLAAGLLTSTSCHRGDVVIAPASAGMLRVTLTGEHADTAEEVSATLLIRQDAVERLLAESYALVPASGEVIDWDEAWKRLTWGRRPGCHPTADVLYELTAMDLDDEADAAVRWEQAQAVAEALNARAGGGASDG